MFSKLRTRIKEWMSDTGAWITLGSQAYAIYRLARSYPGVEHESELRSWIASACRCGGTLAQMTDTDIDDRIMKTAIEIIDDREGWNYLYSIMIRIGKISDIPEKWNNIDMAAYVMGATGTIVSLIQKVREKLDNTELGECYKAQNRILTSKRDINE